MNSYKHSSIKPIIQAISDLLTRLGETDSKAYFIKQSSKEDSFKGLAKNLNSWRTKFVDTKPSIKSKLTHQLKSLEEYFEERQVLKHYKGEKIKKTNIILPVLLMLLGFIMIYIGIEEEMSHSYYNLGGSIIGNKSGLTTSFYGLILIICCACVIYTKKKKKNESI